MTSKDQDGMKAVVPYKPQGIGSGPTPIRAMTGMAVSPRIWAIERNAAGHAPHGAMK